MRRFHSVPNLVLDSGITSAVVPNAAAKERLSRSPRRKGRLISLVAITAAACREAELRGVPYAFLQVEVDNAPAQALYARLGFRYSQRYHYRVAPPA